MMMSVVQESERPSGVDQAGLLDSSTDEPRTVLRVVIENMLYAVSLDMLQQVQTSQRSLITNSHISVAVSNYSAACCQYSDWPTYDRHLFNVKKAKGQTDTNMPYQYT